MHDSAHVHNSDTVKPRISPRTLFDSVFLSREQENSFLSAITEICWRYDPSQRSAFSAEPFRCYVHLSDLDDQRSGQFQAWKMHP